MKITDHIHLSRESQHFNKPSKQNRFTKMNRFQYVVSGKECILYNICVNKSGIKQSVMVPKVWSKITLAQKRSIPIQFLKFGKTVGMEIETKDSPIYRPFQFHPHLQLEGYSETCL